MESAEIEIARQLVVLRVLVVDDEPTMRKVTRSLLRAIGVRTVYEAHDGNSGLEAIRTLLPDVVIVDWEMPSPNGPEFVRAVRSPETFPLPDVPIIMLTGHGERSRVIEAVNLGINEFLLKAGFYQGAARSLCHHHRKAASDGEEGRLLRPRATAAFKL